MVSTAIKEQYALMRSGVDVVNDTSKPRQWVTKETIKYAHKEKAYYKSKYATHDNSSLQP